MHKDCFYSFIGLMKAYCTINTAGFNLNKQDGHESGGAFPSGADRNCNGMSPDHPSVWSPDLRQYPTSVALVRR